MRCSKRSQILLLFLFNPAENINAASNSSQANYEHCFEEVVWLGNLPWKQRNISLCRPLSNCHLRIFGKVRLKHKVIMLHENGAKYPLIAPPI